MPSPERIPFRASGAIAALEAAGVLGEWLREQRSALASETPFSRPAVRRIERALLDQEDLLTEIRTALLQVLAFESAESSAVCRGVVADRCRESLATWRAGMEEAESRSADRERDHFARSLLGLADALEAIVESVYPRRDDEVGGERRAGAKRPPFARAGLPVM
ncbi:MAG: hypothetical protein ACYDBY_00870 [Thermoanaerobaculia bacterium]